MKRKCILFFICLKSTFFYGQIESFDLVKNMERGINLGNVLSAPIEGNWAPKVFEQYFIDVKNAGFKNVRIPIDFYGNRTNGSTSSYSKESGTANSYTGNTSDYTVSEAYLDRVEEVINWSLNQNLITVLDFHGSELKSEFLYTFSNAKAEYTNPSSAKRLADLDKFKAIWLAIANRFKNYSHNLIFEVVNEPYFDVSATEMNEINSLIINAIRSTGDNNLTRNIIITGGGENSNNAPLQISDDIINSDDYLIASFHYYQPFSFTSSSTANYNDYTWGTDSEKNTVQNHFNEVQNWSITKNIPITLGEFGADNENGLNYNTGLYGDYGGPINSDRVEYHRYISEQAINRGFSFSVWDAGNKSNKSIHLRTDNPSTNNSIDNTWVEDVLNALFSSGSWPLCYGSNENKIIVNPNFECGIDTNWNLNVFGNASANYSDALHDSRSGSSAAKIEVNTAESFNKVILSNIIYANDLTNKKITIKAYAKSLEANTNSFKLRVKSNIDGTVTYTPSNEFQLTNTYPTTPFEFTYTIPAQTESIQIQIMVGETEGTYYFDDFETIIEDDSSLSVNTHQSTRESQYSFYPNPTRDYVYVQGGKEKNYTVSLYDIRGKLIRNYKKNSNKIDVRQLKAGIYFLRLMNKNKKHYFSFIKN